MADADPSPHLPDESEAPLLPRFSQQEEDGSQSLILPFPEPYFLDPFTPRPCACGLALSYLRPRADGHTF